MVSTTSACISLADAAALPFTGSALSSSHPELVGWCCADGPNHPLAPVGATAFVSSSPGRCGGSPGEAASSQLVPLEKELEHMMDVGTPAGSDAPFVVPASQGSNAAIDVPT